MQFSWVVFQWTINEQSVFFPFSTETTKWSGMSRTNEARHIKWHETCKCECKVGANVCNN